MDDYIKRSEAIMIAMNYEGLGNAQDASQDIAADLASILAADVRENEWISVDDRLPKNSRYVLCCTQTKTGYINVLRGYFDGKHWCCGMNSNVLFWMEMPEPPKELYQKGVIVGRATKNYRPED